MAYAMTKQGSLDNCVTYEFICDAIEDMNAIEDRYRTIGSVAIVLQGDSGLEVYIAGSDKSWNNLGAMGGSSSDSSAPSLAIHVCTSEEIDEGMPSIDTPDESTIYLVPSSEEEGNLYDEYIYVNDRWEKFGAARIDLSGYVVKNNAVIEDSVSMGRVANSVIGARSTALGSGVTASGDYSHAEGSGAQATGMNAHAEGGGTVASGGQSHAEGNGAKATGVGAHAEGGGTASGAMSHAEGAATTTSGDYSHAEGSGARAIEMGTHAEGGGTTASGRYSHAEGSGANASGMTSHAEGGGTTASGSTSHAEGSGATASGDYAHAEGANTLASGEASHAEGGNTSATYIRAHAEGCGDRTATKTINGVTYTGSGAHGINSHTEGYLTWAIGAGGHAEGAYTVVIGNNAHAEGDMTTASGSCSHAEGSGAKATEFGAHAEGGGTTASGSYSHAEGGGAAASGASSHAEGSGAKATGNAAHAEGSGTTASGDYSHAEGGGARATGSWSHAEGGGTTTSGDYSHAEGNGTIATGSCSHVSGKLNIADSYDNWPEWTANIAYAVGDKIKITSETTVQGYICKTANNDDVFTASNWTDAKNQMNYVEIIGNGDAVDARSNARALDWDGNEYLMGDIYVGCNADSTSGTKLPRIPEAPSTDGTYTLQVTVTNGTPTYSWISLSSLSGVTF